jgi:hypothetical protein
VLNRSELPKKALRVPKVFAEPPHRTRRRCAHALEDAGVVVKNRYAK